MCNLILLLLLHIHTLVILQVHIDSLSTLNIFAKLITHSKCISHLVVLNLKGLSSISRNNGILLALVQLVAFPLFVEGEAAAIAINLHYFSNDIWLFLIGILKSHLTLNNVYSTGVLWCFPHLGLVDCSVDGVVLVFYINNIYPSALHSFSLISKGFMLHHLLIKFKHLLWQINCAQYFGTYSILFSLVSWLNLLRSDIGI